MNAPAVRRTLVHLRDEAGETLLTLDVLMNGWVRLHSLSGRLSLTAETIEELWLEAAASDLSPELYAALLWELDLLALRGDGGWRPG
ncbi:hypothetical protein [Deinococcus marmoris]|uniref:Uncharacterized protein n=1 Tax=Deinococcus marmoris TaxID=249408 RepID=A0A1U7NZH5_9DEIO|nr:hypothetical protein [Deinococcus marmoris]OLV18319.1 hypothetical protein BOO71_0006052 [Deinococcus marmoris]